VPPPLAPEPIVAPLLMAPAPAPAVIDTEPTLGLVLSPPQPAQNRSPYATQATQRRRS
jgi:hypothetical protein